MNHINQVKIYHGNEVIHTHNRICTGFENWRRAMIKSEIAKNFGGAKRFPVANVVKVPFGFCALLTQEGTTSYPLGEVIATARVDQAESMTSKNGSINSSESYGTSKKMHLVFDFGTQVMGTIKGIFFSSCEGSSFEGANQLQPDLLKKVDPAASTSTDTEGGSVCGEYYYYMKHKKIYRIHITDNGNGGEEVCTIDESLTTNGRVFRMTDESFVILEGGKAHKMSKTGQFIETITIGEYSETFCVVEDGTYYGYKEGTMKHYSARGTEIKSDRIVFDPAKIVGTVWSGGKMDCKDNAFLLFARDGSTNEGVVYFERGKMPAMSMSVPYFYDGSSVVRTRTLGLFDKNKILIAAGEYVGKMSTDGVSSAIDLDTPIVMDGTKTLKIVYELNFDSLF